MNDFGRKVYREREKVSEGEEREGVKSEDEGRKRQRGKGERKRERCGKLFSSTVKQTSIEGEL